jgi:hypothetical protein
MDAFFIRERFREKVLDAVGFVGAKVLLNLSWEAGRGLALSKRYRSFLVLPRDNLPLLPFYSEERSVVMLSGLSKLHASSLSSRVDTENLASLLLEAILLRECAGDCECSAFFIFKYILFSKYLRRMGV